MAQTYDRVFSCPVCVHAQLLSHVQLFATPRTVACQASLSMRFPRHEYWSGLPFPLPGDPPNSGIEPASHVSLCIGRWVLFHSANWQALSCSEPHSKLACLRSHPSGHRGPPRPRWKLSQRLRERMTWGDQALVSKARSFIFNRGFLYPKLHIEKNRGCKVSSL